MTSVEVTFPDSLLAALRKAPHEVAAEVRLLPRFTGISSV
jgi:hypothetical protein